MHSFNSNLSGKIFLMVHFSFFFNNNPTKTIIWFMARKRKAWETRSIYIHEAVDGGVLISRLAWGKNFRENGHQQDI